MCEGKTRGRLISSEVLFTAVGIVVAYWFDFGMSFVGGPIAWRLPIAMQIVFALFVIVLVFGLPESPRWLMNHGQEQEAMDVLCAVYDRQPEDEYIVTERRAILSAIEVETSVNKQSFWKIFRNDELKTGQRVLLAWGMQLMNQVGGINLVVYFVPSKLVYSLHVDQVSYMPILSCFEEQRRYEQPAFSNPRRMHSNHVHARLPPTSFYA